MPYKKNKIQKTSLTGIKLVESENMIQRMRRLFANNEPLDEGATPIYTMRKEGVREDTDVRTDRHEAAIIVKDSKTRMKIAKRDGIIPEKPIDNKEKSGDEGTPNIKNDEGTTSTKVS